MSNKDVVTSEYSLLFGDCLERMKEIPDGSVDLTVTSPPYDNLRTYAGTLEWNFDIFKQVANELYRVTKDGGVVVWVVGDATIKGSETGTSFRQALYFKEIGFNLHDTMIYQKQRVVPLTHNRYEQCFEFMFILSKGKPKSFNPIMVECKYAGQETWGNASFHKTNDSGLISVGKKKINSHKQKENIWSFLNAKDKSLNHPAPFPEQLANDHIISWSNENDVVFDPFMGSGTTGKMAKLNNRKFIGIEKVSEYFDIGVNRMQESASKGDLK